MPGVSGKPKISDIALVRINDVKKFNIQKTTQKLKKLQNTFAEILENGKRIEANLT